MSAPRLLTLGTAAFFASGVSIDPELRAIDRAPRPRPAIAKEPPKAEPVGRIETAGDAPADVRVEVTPDARGHRVVVRRTGFLVSLRHEDARAAGEDHAAMHLAARAGDGRAADRLVWETTRPATLGTDRGVITLSLAGGTLRADIVSARAPEPFSEHRSKHATCAAHRDGLGGFTVLCRFAKGTKHIGAANVTGAASQTDVWLTSGPSPIVRLDLPRNEGGAEGRVIGFSFGTTGVVLRAEATFPEGGKAALLLEESSRAQPLAP